MNNDAVLILAIVGIMLFPILVMAICDYPYVIFLWTRQKMHWSRQARERRSAHRRARIEMARRGEFPQISEQELDKLMSQEGESQ